MGADVNEYLMLLFLMLAGHALADYPLQGDFLAVGKGSRTTPHCGIPWWHCLTAHALIHGLFVAVLTGSPGFGVIESVLHWAIDDMKCRKITGINTDQALHVACKVGYVAAFWLMGSPVWFMAIAP